VALLSTFFFSSACQGWHLQEAAPESSLAVQHRGPIRITRMDSSQVVLRDAVMRADTIFGVVTQNGIDEQTRIPAADVRYVESRGFSTGKTVGLFFGLVLAVVAALAIGFETFYGGSSS
jgi:hypothetical protein